MKSETVLLLITLAVFCYALYAINLLALTVGVLVLLGIIALAVNCFAVKTLKVCCGKK
jgi:hypothetical protein